MKRAILLSSLLLASAAWALTPEQAEKLASADPEVRSDACLELADSGPDAVAALRAKLRDDSLLVRHSAAYALGRIGGPAAEKVFREGLASAGYDLRRVSALGLGMLGQRDVLEVLRPLAADDNWEVRWAAVYALGRSGDRRALPLLRRLARTDPRRDDSGRWPVREAAREAAGRIEGAIGWRNDLEAAGREAAAAGRPLVVYLRQEGELCARYEREVLSREQVIDALQMTIPVWADYRENPQTFRSLAVERAPAWVCLAPGGKVISRETGALSPSRVQETVLGALELGASPARLRERLSARPGDLSAAWQLAGLCLEEGQSEEAERMAREIARADPDNVSSLLDNAVFILAYIRGQRGDYAGSARDLRKMLKTFAFSGERARALYCLGLAELRSGNPDAAREALAQVARDYPGTELAATAETVLAGKVPGR